MKFTNSLNRNFTRADGIGTMLYFNVFYSDNSEETNDTGYVIKVYDNTTNDCTTNFSITNLGYYSNHWTVHISALPQAALLSNYFIGVSKLPGNEGDILPEEYSFVDLTTNGFFNVNPAVLSLSNISMSPLSVQLTEPVTLRFNIIYPDNSTKITAVKAETTNQAT